MDIRVKFIDFWSGFNHHNYYIFKMMCKTNFNISIDNDNPNIIIGSAFGNTMNEYNNCIKIFYTGENIKPNFYNYDYFIGYEFSNDERILRLPIYQLHWGNLDYTEKQDFFKKELSKSRNKFCAFIHSNPRGYKRNEFFNKLSEYKKIDSGGIVFNNIGYTVDSKIEWLKDYKFCICFENESQNGYLTEKLLDAMMGGCIPIYWGSESCSKEFNPKSFLNWHDYGDDDKIINRIIEIDKNYEEYIKIYNEPYLIDNKPNEYMDDNRVISFFQKIFSTL
jgi:hypothetical protein